MTIRHLFSRDVVRPLRPFQKEADCNSVDCVFTLNYAVLLLEHNRLSLPIVLP